MKAVILLATLKKDERSNTELLSQFLIDKMKKHKISCKLIKLVDYNILPGTYSDMGEGDEWPQILHEILEAQLVILATPVWWGGHSSEAQKVIERLDELHDELMKKGKSKLEGKVGGIVVTGESDGAEHIIGNISNFFNAVGLLLPPFTTLTVLWEGHDKNAKPSTSRILEKYKKEYSDTAEKMVKQLLKYSRHAKSG